jgi:hypothetical protein
MDWLILLIGGGVFTYLGMYLYYLNSLPLLIIRLFGWGVFILTEEHTTQHALKKLQGISAKVYQCEGTFVPYDLMIGKWYIAHIIREPKFHGKDGSQITILCSQAFVTQISTVPKISQLELSSPESRVIDVMCRNGGHYNTYYSQQAVITEISNIYKSKHRATVLLHGPPGTGKPVTAILLALELGGKFCKSFNPTEPGDSIVTLLFNNSIPDKSVEPIVILLDEIDVMIKKIENPTDIARNRVPIQVYNKQTFNSFLDDMELYQNVVLVMTTNLNEAELDALDPSYFCPGRVTKRFRMEELVGN